MLTAKQYSAKEDAFRILEKVDDSDDFDIILFEMYVRKKVEERLADKNTGNTVHDDDMAQFWLRW